MEYSKEAPEQWEEVYKNIRWSFSLLLIMRALKVVSCTIQVGSRQMRRHRTAPVDTMGCERAHDEDAEPHVRRLSQLSHALYLQMNVKLN